jgi:hypothetical protein
MDSDNQNADRAQEPDKYSGNFHGD